MLIVRATKKLRDRIGPPDLQNDERSTTLLGEWYATRFAWRPDVLLLVNESTLLPVLLPLAPAATALSRAVDRVAAAMAAYGAPDTVIAAELDEMRGCRIAPTANRSILGIMNEFASLAEVYRHRARPDLGELAKCHAGPRYADAGQRVDRYTSDSRPRSSGDRATVS